MLSLAGHRCRSSVAALSDQGRQRELAFLTAGKSTHFGKGREAWEGCAPGIRATDLCQVPAELGGARARGTPPESCPIVGWSVY